ncbi:MAG: DUF1156 domain-containing protein, partial [Dehalococcoidia bacterium]|nr:DUF1156 domain-containing protein [Dehalococcoidia bacterium]
MTTPHVERPSPVVDMASAPSFMEVQFPVSKLSKESYAERKAANSQSLTALGKWWGRKPLILVRAALLGLLLPASADPDKDREVFLALMTMDDDGFGRRLRDSIPPTSVNTHLTESERGEYFSVDGAKPKWRSGVSSEDKRHLQRVVLRRMSYDEKLKYCARPEEIDGPGPDDWQRINEHLGTSATRLPDLVDQLSARRFGRTARVADPFSGGGSIPFEAARLGFDSYGADLSPVAAVLTWGSAHIIGGGDEVQRRIYAAQAKAYELVRDRMRSWGIEESEEGWVADGYMYCLEARDPMSGWTVPFPLSVIATRYARVISRLVPIQAEKRFDIEIIEDATADEIAQASTEATWRNGILCPVDEGGRWLPPSLRKLTPVAQLRGPQGLRLWERDDLVPRQSDVLQERLFCIRWTDPSDGTRHYRAPTKHDLDNEVRVLELLRERLPRWQELGYVPTASIEPGDKTAEPLRTRGWTHWRNFFTPRQLLLAGLLGEAGDQMQLPLEERASLLLSVGRQHETSYPQPAVENDRPELFEEYQKASLSGFPRGPELQYEIYRNLLPM